MLEMTWPMALLIYFLLNLPENVIRESCRIKSMARWKDLNLKITAATVLLAVTFTLTHISDDLSSTKSDVASVNEKLRFSGYKTRLAGWDVANVYCTSKGDNLTLIKTNRLFQRETTLSDSLFWVGGYVMFTQWKWNDCSRLCIETASKTGRKNEGLDIRNNNYSELCFLICHNYTSISFEVEIYLCAKHWSKVIKIPLNHCRKSCSKTRQQKCGGQEASSVYVRDTTDFEFKYD